MHRSLSLLLVSVGAIVLMSASPAAAQYRGHGPYKNGSFDKGYYQGPSDYYNSGRRSVVASPAPVYTYVAPQPVAQVARNENEALLRVHVPAGAQVWIEGDRTQQQGEFRNFVSPPLKSNHRYVYHLKAQWMDNGKPVETVRTVEVTPGQRVNVDFLDARSAQK